MELTNVQQYLLSYFNLTKVASLKSALEIFEEVINKSKASIPSTEEQLYREVSKINNTIGKYDLEVSESIDEVTCEKVFVLINTADSVVTQTFKFYDDNISQLFAKIVKEIMISEDGCISETHCLNLSMQVKMSKASCQSLLENFIKDKWLISMNDKISLGMRSIVELEQNIKQHYSESLKICPFCRLLVIQGFICTNCQTKCHFACLKKFYVLSKSNCVCPSCKATWKDIPEHLIDEHVESQKEESMSNLPVRKKKRKN